MAESRALATHFVYRDGIIACGLREPFERRTTRNLYNTTCGRCLKIIYRKLQKRDRT